MDVSRCLGTSAHPRWTPFPRAQRTPHMPIFTLADADHPQQTHPPFVAHARRVQFFLGMNRHPGLLSPPLASFRVLIEENVTIMIMFLMLPTKTTLCFFLLIAIHIITLQKVKHARARNSMLAQPKHLVHF